LLATIPTPKKLGVYVNPFVAASLLDSLCSGPLFEDHDESEDGYQSEDNSESENGDEFYDNGHQSEDGAEFYDNGFRLRPSPKRGAQSRSKPTIPS